MRILSLLSVCALAWFANACEQHPLPGDPLPGDKQTSHGPANPAAGGADVSHGKAAGQSENVPPATRDAKSEEAPKFFPEKK